MGLNRKEENFDNQVLKIRKEIKLQLRLKYIGLRHNEIVIKQNQLIENHYVHRKEEYKQ